MKEVNYLDTKTVEQRSVNMANIKSKKTAPEMFVRKNLYKRGLRYRVNYSKIPGKPDLYFTKEAVAVFVNGCFWHQHENCRFSKIPKTNIDYWQKKLWDNKERDVKNLKELHLCGIRTLIIWECTIKKMKKEPEFCNNIFDQLIEFVKSSSNQNLEI